MSVPEVLRGRGPVLAALLAGVGWLLASGIPTGMIETPLYVRMTPVEWWNYPFWVTNSVLVGLLAATYDAPGASGPTGAAWAGGCSRSSR